MPVMLSPEAEELWLDENGPQEGLLSLLVPYRADEMKAFAVSPLVNSPQNNVPEVLYSLRVKDNCPVEVLQNPK